jgi:hypothetical protein
MKNVNVSIKNDIQTNKEYQLIIERKGYLLNYNRNSNYLLAVIENLTNQILELKTENIAFKKVLDNESININYID